MALEHWVVTLGEPAPAWLWSAVREGEAIPLPYDAGSPAPWGSDGLVVRTSTSAVLAKHGDTLVFDGDKITVEKA